MRDERPRPTRQSDVALAVVGVLAGLFLATVADAAWLRATRARPRRQNAALVARLGLTDLCLFTEARYTRHWSQADLHSAFQDHPGAFEHDPSGSLLGPPPSLGIHHAELDR